MGNECCGEITKGEEDIQAIWGQLKVIDFTYADFQTKMLEFLSSKSLTNDNAEFSYLTRDQLTEFSKAYIFNPNDENLYKSYHSYLISKLIMGRDKVKVTQLLFTLFPLFKEDSNKYLNFYELINILENSKLTYEKLKFHFNAYLDIALFAFTTLIYESPSCDEAFKKEIAYIFENYITTNNKARFTDYIFVSYENTDNKDMKSSTIIDKEEYSKIFFGSRRFFNLKPLRDEFFDM